MRNDSLLREDEVGLLIFRQQTALEEDDLAVDSVLSDLVTNRLRGKVKPSASRAFPIRHTPWDAFPTAPIEMQYAPALCALTSPFIDIFPQVEPLPALDRFDDVFVPFPPKHSRLARGRVISRKKATFSTAFADQVLKE